MKLPTLFKIEVTGLKEVIDLQAKYDELQRGIGDLLLHLIHPEKDNESLLNKDERLKWVIDSVLKLQKENKELKEKVNEV